MLFKILLHHLFHQLVGGADQTGTLVAGVFVEEAQQVMAARMMSSLDFREGAFNLIDWSKDRSFLVPFRVKVAGTWRGLGIMITDNLMLQYQLAHELRCGILPRGRVDDRDEQEISAWAVTSHYRDLPGPRWGHRQELRGQTVSYAEEGGTVKLDGETVFFSLSPKTLYRGFRLLAARTGWVLDDRANRDRTWLLLGLGLVLTGLTLVGWMVTRMLLAPLEMLGTAFERVGGGDLAFRLPVTGTDEAARAVGHLDALVNELREKERMETYLSDEVRQAVRAEVARGGAAAVETREITILFSDMRDFTSISERNPPEEIFASLNAYFEGIEPLVRAHGGQIQKYIGDAVYAVFPEPGTAGARGAVAAARAIRAYLAEFNAGREREGRFPIRVGFGITTGPVLWGRVGSEERQDYVFVGPDVSRAAALESLSKQGSHTGIILTPSTLALLGPDVAAVPLPHDRLAAAELLDDRRHGRPGT